MSRSCSPTPKPTIRSGDANDMFIRRVTGNSMSPAIPAGSIVIARRSQPKTGDIVIARQGNRDVIKRAQSVNGARVYLVGDNLHVSTDSRQLGPVSKQDILGVVMMKFTAPRAMPAPKIKKKELLAIPYLLAGAVTLMLLLQLFEFEDFVPLMESITGNQTGGRFLAVSIVAAELFSLPFLLRMKLSPLARIASSWLTVILPLIWLLLIIARPAGNIGLLGTKVSIESGMTNLLVAFVLAVLSLASFYILSGPYLAKGLKHRR